MPCGPLRQTALVQASSLSWESAVQVRSEMASRRKHNAHLYGRDMPDHVDVVRLLLQYGADVDARDEEGSSALHYAAFKGVPSVARVLLEEGHADHLLKDNQGTTALRKAVDNGEVAVARIIRKHMARRSRGEPKAEL